jgi:cation transport ATPase
VLVKSVATLEAARNLTAIVFDKTGTVTTGVLTVTRLSPAPGVDGGDLLRWAASAEQNSRHPVARAVTEMARRTRVGLATPTRFEEVAGRGVAATFADGVTVLVGRASWLADAVPGPHEVDAAALDRIQSSSEAEGLSLLHVVRDGRHIGWIGLEDNARPEAAGAVDRLRSMGISRLVLLTGDRASVARRVAGQMHFDDFKAEVLPHEKLEMVDGLKAAGHRVAVIGDGVNDAPALAAGDVSVPRRSLAAGHCGDPPEHDHRGPVHRRVRGAGGRRLRVACHGGAAARRQRAGRRVQLGAARPLRRGPGTGRSGGIAAPLTAAAVGRIRGQPTSRSWKRITARLSTPTTRQAA